MDMTKDDRPVWPEPDDAGPDFYDSQSEPFESECPPPVPLDPLPPDARRVCFYYVRNQLNHPVVTVCLIRINDETARGLAICAPEPIRDRFTGRLTYDIPSKQRGRDLAEKRARKAIVKRTNDKLIRKPLIKALLWKLSTQTHCCLPDWKSEYMPSLTHFEHRLLYAVREPKVGVTA